MPKQILSDIFGFSEFRKGQENVIQSISEQQSALAVFPTGSGKSLCYQLPALMLPELTLVVSPLLALIQDQLDFLKSKGISATRIDSSLEKQEEVQIMNGIRQKEYKILFISVERFKNERFRNFLTSIPVSLLVVDEAHCISEWGHNFRPDYLKLPGYQKEFNIPQALLLTATATPEVVQDMCTKFNIDKKNATITGFYRSNLNLVVKPVQESEKEQILHSIISEQADAPTIVYVTLQKTAELVANTLVQKGINAKAYHAGLKNEEREAIQNLFMDNSVNCIVATIAFGMGIDKNNIRRVIHFDLPKSIENYSQEIGRAGRDGLNAECIVLANKNNINVLENFIYGDTPELSGIKALISEIPTDSDKWEVLPHTLPGITNIRTLPLRTLLVYLEMKDVIKPLFSYFANYRFALKAEENELINRFNGERKNFLKAIFDHSEKARKWYTVNFENISKHYNTNRERIVAALEYFNEQGLIELESKQNTEVFQVLDRAIQTECLSHELHELFKKKETTEVQRIHNMLDFFENNECLSIKLAAYFGEKLQMNACGHCSVCNSGPITMTDNGESEDYTKFNYSDLTNDFTEKFKETVSSDLITRFLCGIYVPVFSKTKAKQLSGFGIFEKQQYSLVKEWVEQNRS